ncbi:the Gap domain of Smap1l stromal membrane-associated protein 1-like protein, partial [Chytriomyces sp. MP71]
MSKPSKREAERNQQELKTLLEVPENTQCADCGDPKPKWASANLGVFLCIRCAGLHRNMGRDVSAIKSVTLDSWSDKEVMRMKEIGNRRARALYLARGNPPPVSVNSPDQDVYRLIKDKYKHGKYMRSG